MRTRRATALFLCLAMLLAALFAGCQQTPTTTKAPTGTTAASIAGTTSAATTTAGTAKQISVWCKWKPEDSLTLDAKKFEAENKITVELVVLPDFTEIMRRLQVASASGQKPNIAGVDLIQVPVINKMLELEDLNKFIATDPSVNFADFYPALVNYSKLGGKQLALPLETSNIIMYYNKKLFKEAGLDPEKPPVTWDDIVEYGIKLTKPGVWGYCFGFHDTYAEALSWQFQIQVWSNGAKTWTDDYTKVLFDSPEAVEAL